MGRHLVDHPRSRAVAQVLAAAILDNNPVTSGLPGSLGALRLGFRIRKDLEVVGAELSPGESDVTHRPLCPISELGLESGRRLRTPKQMQTRVADHTPRVEPADFRDELRLSNYPGAGRSTWPTTIPAIRNSPTGIESAPYGSARTSSPGPAMGAATSRTGRSESGRLPTTWPLWIQFPVDDDVRNQIGR